jgi:hypothetical protein
MNIRRFYYVKMPCIETIITSSPSLCVFPFFCLWLNRLSHFCELVWNIFTKSVVKVLFRGNRLSNCHTILKDAMDLYPYFPYFLADFGEIHYRRFPNQGVEIWFPGNKGNDNQILLKSVKEILQYFFIYVIFVRLESYSIKDMPTDLDE